jgi:hypothetical protein
MVRQLTRYWPGGGVVSIEQFGAMSSGTVAPKKGQVSSKSILDTLKAAQIVSDEEYEGYGKCVYICQSYLESPDWKGLKGRQRIELLMLDALREWAKKLGLASYNLVAIRGESALRPVGPYGFDLTGPSYLLPLRKAQLQPGFFVADVVAEGILNEHQVRYFLRKVQSLKIALTAGVFPILLAEGFTGEALTAGHKAGAVFATYKDLFGSRVGNALHILLTVLKNAAAHAAADPEKIAVLLDSLTDIEGSAGNLRGILFELISASLIRMNAASIDIGITATNPSTGKRADIDVLAVYEQAGRCLCIECKGKSPGGEVTLEEVEDWIARIPVFLAHLKNHHSLREAHVTLELWTSGTFHPDALVKLREQKEHRTKNPINWKDGQEVLAIARKHKLKSIAHTLQVHYLKHPLSDTGITVERNASGNAVLATNIPPPFDTSKR